MASVNIEDKKADDEAPVQASRETKDEDTSQAQISGKEVTSVPGKQEGSSAEGGTEEVNGDAKADDQKGDPEIKGVGEEQGTAANDEVEETNSDNKGEGSGEEEDEGDNEVETEGEGEREEMEVPKKGSKTDAKKDKKVSAKSIKNSVEKKGKKDSSLKEPVTPTIERPARERKTVERYSVPSPGRFGKSSAGKALSIEKVCWWVHSSLYIAFSWCYPPHFKKRFSCLRAVALRSRIFQMVSLDFYVIFFIKIKINVICSLVFDVG